jgi:hypothetical protein
MPRIMIRRPTRQEAVPTGLTTDIIKLDTLDIPVTMRCPRDRIHRWKQKNAWIEEERQAE